MMRKKTALHLDARYITLIENAYYYANPPESKQEERKQRPPMHEYIRKLLFKDLNKLNTERIIKQIRKLDWDEPTVSQIMCIRVRSGFGIGLGCNACNVKSVNYSCLDR